MGSDIATPQPPIVWDLQTLTLAAIYFNPQLIETRARLGLAEAAIITASQRPNPSLEAAPQYTTTKSALSPWTIGFNLNLPIETAGKRSLRIKREHYLAEAARLAVVGATWQIRANVQSALMTLWRARKIHRLITLQLGYRDKVVHLLERQLAVGAITPSQVSPVRIARQQTKLALYDAIQDEITARVSLAVAVGISSEALERVALKFSTFEQPLSDLPAPEVRRRALLGRWDLLAAIAEYATAEAALELEIAKQYPDINLSPGYEFDQDDNKWGIGVSFELPVLNHNQGPIAEAKSLRDVAAARFNALQINVLGELDTNFSAYRAALEKLAPIKALRLQLEQQNKSIRARFEAGDISRQELTSANLEIAVAMLAQFEAMAASQQARIELENVLQSPLDLPMAWFAPPITSTSLKAHEN